MLMGASAPAALHADVALAVTDPVAQSVRFDSQVLNDKRPFGAVPAGTTVDFILHAKPGVSRATLILEKRRLEGNQTVLEYTEVARIPLKPSPEGDLQAWHGSYSFKDVSVYGYYFALTIHDVSYVYELTAPMETVIDQAELDRMDRVAPTTAKPT